MFRNFLKKTGFTRFIFLTFFISVNNLQAQFTLIDNMPRFEMQGNVVLKAPEEGLWSIATGWENNWMSQWTHIYPEQKEIINGWTILKGKMQHTRGEMLLTDSYKSMDNGLIRCIRRFEWTGPDTLKNATLSVRFQMEGKNLKPLLPGTLYYGNLMGAKVNPDIIPVYKGANDEFAIFEDHRYPMPFIMLENARELTASALYFTPSPVRGAVLADQWWSAGIETKENYSEIVLYSGPIGYNGQHSVAKALQKTPMAYDDTYLNIEPGRIIEKEFFIEIFPIERAGSGFQKPVYTALNLFKPYDSNRFTEFQEIVKMKYEYAKTRWIDEDGAIGFGMYDLNSRKDIVMGWCGQAGSLGYALQRLSTRINDEQLTEKVQRSLDFLANFPINDDGLFPVGYNVKEKRYYGGDHVSCGQAMNNIAKAIETARENSIYSTGKWESFLKEVSFRQSKRVLDEKWNPLSTAEGFYVAPLILAYDLFNEDIFRLAAVKIAEEYAFRHLEMDGCYWGGTLDATCEDKEGAWAAFQGFLALYERSKNDKYLDWAKHAMDVCLTYTVVWDIPQPAGQLADFNFKSTGWTVVSPQNQHIDVYGVLYTPEIYKMGIYLKDERLTRLAKVMYRSCSQLIAPWGSQGEQLQQTNFAQRGDMTDDNKLRGGYSEGWTVFWITAHFLNAAARFEELGVEP